MVHRDLRPLASSTRCARPARADSASQRSAPARGVIRRQLPARSLGLTALPSIKSSGNRASEAGARSLIRTPSPRRWAAWTIRLVLSKSDRQYPQAGVRANGKRSRLARTRLGRGLRLPTQSFVAARPHYRGQSQTSKAGGAGTPSRGVLVSQRLKISLSTLTGSGHGRLCRQRQDRQIRAEGGAVLAGLVLRRNHFPGPGALQDGPRRDRRDP